MSNLKKKVFPKIKKSFKNFLTDESGKITKKDALWISAAAMALSVLATEPVVARHRNSNFHNSAIGTSQNPNTFNFFPTDAQVTPNMSRTNTFAIVNNATCNHASWIVNWHYSQVPQVNTSTTSVDFNKWHNNSIWHANHSSHSSHSSGWWC